MNRIDRLFAMLLKISDGKLFRAEALAAEWALSERTIYRDMRALMQMGVPIRSEAGVGYQLRPGYFLPPLIFEKYEAIAAGLALKMLSAYSTDQITAAAGRAFQKIHAVLPKGLQKELTSALEILDVITPLPIPFSDKNFRLLTTSIRARRAVEIDYQGYRRPEPERRLVEPMKLFLSPGRNVWYLDAFCRNRQAWRSFRLDRISWIGPTAIEFFPRERDADLNENHPTVAVLTFAAEAARWVRESQHWSLASERPLPDGSVEMTYRHFRWDAFGRWFFSVAGDVTGVEPEDARTQLRKMWQALDSLLT